MSIYMYTLQSRWRSFDELIEQFLAEIPDEPLHNFVQDKVLVKKAFCEKSEGSYIAVDGVTIKKSASVWSFRDHRCEACGKAFTQNHSLHEHQKHACKRAETQKYPKFECSKCGKTVSTATLYKHQKKGCPKNKKVSTCAPPTKEKSEAELRSPIHEPDEVFQRIQTLSVTKLLLKQYH
ncbi:hypothetical protein OS493_040145, partial [Desmophyllum pertusum]